MFRSGREHRGLIPYKAEIQEETQHRVFMTLSLPTERQEGDCTGHRGPEPPLSERGKEMESHRVLDLSASTSTCINFIYYTNKTFTKHNMKGM